MNEEHHVRNRSVLLVLNLFIVSPLIVGVGFFVSLPIMYIVLVLEHFVLCELALYGVYYLNERKLEKENEQIEQVKCADT